MVEILGLIAEDANRDEGKQLNDRSYQSPHSDESGQTDESGIGSQNDTDREHDGEKALVSSGYDTASHDESNTSKWENFVGEIMNFAVLNRYLQSSNIPFQDKACEISTIEHTGGTPKLRKG